MTSARASKCDLLTGLPILDRGGYLNWSIAAVPCRLARIDHAFNQSVADVALLAGLSLSRSEDRIYQNTVRSTSTTDLHRL